MQKIANYLGLTLSDLRDKHDENTGLHIDDYHEYVSAYQQAVSARVTAQMEEVGVTVEDIVTQTGIDRATAFDCTRGKLMKLNDAQMDALTELLETTSHYLLFKTDDPYDYDRDPEERLRDIPYSTLEELRDIYGDNMAAIWEIWEESNNDIYEDLKATDPAVYARIQYEKNRYETERRRRQPRFKPDSASLQELSPTIAKLDKLPRETRRSLIESFDHMVNVFIGKMIETGE
jgi:hypothetical protein